MTNISTNLHTKLQDANAALRSGDFEYAIQLYNNIKTDSDVFMRIICFNICYAGLKIRQKNQSVCWGDINSVFYKGDFHLVENVIRGWIYRDGSIDSHECILQIDNNHSFQFIADKYGVNKLSTGLVVEGHHCFDITLPDCYFVTSSSIEIKLIDAKTSICVVKKICNPVITRKYSSIKEVIADSFNIIQFKAPNVAFSKKIFTFFERLANRLSKFGGYGTLPLVSVIMPVYNRASIVMVAINSVLNQTYKNIELVIVDDGSTDGTVDLIRSIKDQRIKLFINKLNIGVSKTRNKAVVNSCGSYIMYLDSDNTWDQRFVSAMVGAFKFIKDVDVLYSGQYLYFGSDSSPRELRFGNFSRSLLSNRNYIDMNVLCHKRDCFNRVNGFDVSLSRQVDWDFILRLSNEYNIKFIPIVLSNYHYELVNNTITRNVKNSQVEQSVRESFLSCDVIVEDVLLDTEFTLILHGFYNLNDCYKSVFKILESIRPSLLIMIYDVSSDDVEQYNTDDMQSILFIHQGEENLFDVIFNSKFNILGNVLVCRKECLISKLIIWQLKQSMDVVYKDIVLVPEIIVAANDKRIKMHVPYANKNFMCNISLSHVQNNICPSNYFYSNKLVKLRKINLMCAYISRTLFKKAINLNRIQLMSMLNERTYFVSEIYVKVL